ncbi:MAG: nucleotidyltransferase family protein [Ignavibacteriaceae bacterium]|nr:nucleotidyltransferase family protein [Ignavibacteriaceae bacterium]
MRAMILAAGLGTRLKPLTDSTPKALIKIKGRTLLELQISKLKAEGFDQIIINVHHFADQIEDYLKQNNFFNCSIEISDEKEKLLETGGGLKKASHFFSDEDPFLVYNVDILSNINLNKLMDFHLVSSSIATLAVQDRSSSRKFLFDKSNTLCGWVNENSGEKIMARDAESELLTYSFSGIQVVDPKMFKYFPDKNVFSLIELYLAVAKKENIIGYVHNEDEWIDLGKMENLHEAEKVFDNIRSTYLI